ncbi:MAG: HK97 family phage prohead protease [Bacilli bacterium]
MPREAETAEVKLLTSPLEVKQVNMQERTFEGLASTWSLDLGLDVIKKGAFRQTLKEWRSSGKIIPLLDSHNWFSVRDAVGRLVDAKETEDGLWTLWKIVPGTDGDEILARLRPDEDGVAFIDSMSIGYRTIKAELDEDSGIRTIKELELHEVSLVLFPMNPEARIDNATVKEFAASVKSFISRVPSDAQGQFREAVRKVVQPRPEDATKEELEEAAKAASRKKTTPAPPTRTGNTASTKKAPAKESPAALEGDDRGAPDTSLFDQLRLRRLDTFAQHISH